MGVIVRFLRPDGGLSVMVRAEPGARLLDVAQTSGQPLEGTCNGQMACATCHVVLDPVTAAVVPGPSVEEEDLLDLTPRVTRGSRLACQVRLPADLDEIMVRLS